MNKNIKYKQSETLIIKRSAISFAPYNPKVHSKEAIAEQKRNIKRIGILGGIIWNQETGNLVSGHKRIMALDEINKYEGDATNDYEVKVEMVQLDEKTEKEQNIYMDTPAANTPQDIDLLATLIPEIDYKNAGLTTEDLQLIGIDFTLQTEEEINLSQEIDTITNPIQDKKLQTKELKAHILREAKKKAENIESYVVIAFGTSQAKASFVQRFGFDPKEKFIKGELFEQMIERVDG